MNSPGLDLGLIHSFACGLPVSASRVLRSAEQMLVDELAGQRGWQCVASAPLTITIEQQVQDGPLAAQGFRLQIAHLDAGGSIRVQITGGDDRGCLYGVCELLDRLWRSDHLDICDITESPRVLLRGNERHWHPDPTTADGAVRCIAFVKHLARRRVNLVAWCASWACQFHNLLSFRAYAPLHRLHDPAPVSEARRCFRLVLEACHDHGIDVCLSTTEFIYPVELESCSPQLFRRDKHTGLQMLDLDQDETWAWYRAKFSEICAEFPTLFGIELWLTEALEAYQCHSRMTPCDRYARMISEARSAMDEASSAHQQLLVRTFMHHPAGDGLISGLIGTLGDTCMAVMKSQVEDFHLGNDPNPLVGVMAPGREIVEFDLTGEYRGGTIGIMACIPEFLRERMAHSLERGVCGFMFRYRVFSDESLMNTAHGDLLSDFTFDAYDALNSLVYFSMCWHGTADIEALWRRWARGRFPDSLYEHFVLSGTAMRQANYIQGKLANQTRTFPSSLAELEWALTNDARNPANHGLHAMLPILEPTNANRRTIMDEKYAAMRNGERMAELVEAHRHLVSAEDQRLLDRVTTGVRIYTRCWAASTDAYLCARLVMHGTDVDRWDTFINALEAYRAAAATAPEHPWIARAAQCFTTELYHYVVFKYLDGPQRARVHRTWRDRHWPTTSDRALVAAGHC